MGGKRKRGNYERAPQVPEHLAERVAVVVSTLAGHERVSGGAHRLGLSRVQFQTVTHRAMGAVVQAVTPRPPGPAPEPQEMKQLRADNERLRRALAEAEDRAAMFQRFMGVASDLLHGNVKLNGRGPRSRSSSTKSPGAPPAKKEEPEPAAAQDTAVPAAVSSTPAIPTTTTTTANRAAATAVRPAASAEECRGELLSWAREARSRRMTAVVIAALLGVGASTLRRWQRRRLSGERLYRRRGAAVIGTEKVARIEERVRATKGLVGVEALRRSVAAGVPRRAIAQVKRAAVTEMERERVARSSAVEVSVPGVVRGFDAMYVQCAEERAGSWCARTRRFRTGRRWRWCLRTTRTRVLRFLLRDFLEHGTPLVVRMDRAQCQRTEEVATLLEQQGALVLHGPPGCAQYYGQLERQNREHRAWLAGYEGAPAAVVAAAVAEMKQVLNTLWPRPSLGWQAPEQAWTGRPAMRENRQVLRREVNDRAARVAANDHEEEEVDELKARRYAIETALIRRGYLAIETGTAC